jgi:hypothetical protein
MSEAEDRGHGGVASKDTLELLIVRAEEEMMRLSSGIQQGEIDIVPHGEFECRHNKDYGSVGSPVELARGPWIRTIARHLYKLNPKLDASLTQDCLRGTQFSQLVRGTDLDKLPVGKNKDETGSFERILLESCPILQSLVVDESSLLEESMSAEATMTQGTLSTTITNNSSVLDSIRPTTIATLQFLCACAKSFP